MIKPESDISSYNRFIERMMHVVIIATLLGICLKVLLF